MSSEHKHEEWKDNFMLHVMTHLESSHAYWKKPRSHAKKEFIEFICGISANKITTRWFWPKHCDLCTSCTSPVSRFQAMGKTRVQLRKIRSLWSKLHQQLLIHDLSRRCSKNQNDLIFWTKKKRLHPEKGHQHRRPHRWVSYHFCKQSRPQAFRPTSHLAWNP